jgi:hypothetical protein
MSSSLSLVGGSRQANHNSRLFLIDINEFQTALFGVEVKASQSRIDKVYSNPWSPLTLSLLSGGSLY